MAYAAIDAGADIVAGHHIHTWQPMEVYKGKPIFYGLGNFAFGSRNRRAKEGLLIRAVFLEKALNRVEIFPLYVKNADPKINFQTKLMKEYTFAFFPYLKTSQPVRYRDLTIRSTEDLNNVPADTVPHIKILREMFFLRDHLRIKKMSYLVYTISTSINTLFVKSLMGYRDRHPAPIKTDQKQFFHLHQTKRLRRQAGAFDGNIHCREEELFYHAGSLPDAREAPPFGSMNAECAPPVWRPGGFRPTGR